jgi:hypothetical protein
MVAVDGVLVIKVKVDAVGATMTFDVFMYGLNNARIDCPVEPTVTYCSSGIAVAKFTEYQPSPPLSVILVTLADRLIATVPVPLKLTHALAP